VSTFTGFSIAREEDGGETLREGYLNTGFLNERGVRFKNCRKRIYIGEVRRARGGEKGGSLYRQSLSRHKLGNRGSRGDALHIGTSIEGMSSSRGRLKEKRKRSLSH